MSIQAVAWALEQDLPARPKLVLVSIANHANHTDGYCWLRAETIAHEAACTPRSVYTFVGGLVRNGFIRKVPRRGEDGKQRANDYWIVFERDEKEWDWGAHPESGVGDGEPTDSASTESDDAISGVPSEAASHGETPEPHERHDTRQAVDKHVPSAGPSEATFSRKRIAEPSESKSEASSAGARVRSAALRSYRPPPLQPIAADPNHKNEELFVFAGTPAYEAWAFVKSRQNGLNIRPGRPPPWQAITQKFIEGKDGEPGKWRSGWYFPTLFPPEERQQGPPTKARPDNLTEQDRADFK